MPKANVAVTVWARRLLVFLSVVSVVSVGLFSLYTSDGNEDQIDTVNKKPSMEECTPIGSSDTCITLGVVSDLEDRRLGLSGREYLDAKAGMLFDFSSEAIRCMWMPDMNFSIDIIWIDASGEVVDVMSDISPDTYPETFCGDEPAQYVIEVNAGVIDEAQVSVGQTIDITPLMVR